MTVDLFQTGVDLMRQNLRRSHPAASDQELERRLREWLLSVPEQSTATVQGDPST